MSYNSINSKQAPSLADIVRNVCNKTQENNTSSQMRPLESYTKDEWKQTIEQGAYRGLKINRLSSTPDMAKILQDAIEKHISPKKMSYKEELASKVARIHDAYEQGYEQSSTEDDEEVKTFTENLNAFTKNKIEKWETQLRNDNSMPDDSLNSFLENKKEKWETQLRNDGENPENHVTQLIHLAQMHTLPFGIKPLPEVVEAIVNSQIKVANYIKNHPESLVFLEGLVQNQTGIPNDTMTHVVAKVLFPKGLPEDASSLNSLQKEFLSDKDGEGSVRILNRLGELKSMHRTISLEKSKIIHSKIVRAKNFEDASIYINESREKAAMSSIQEVLKDNPHVKKVILVFGASHDFSPYCREYGFKHEKVDCL